MVGRTRNPKRLRRQLINVSVAQNRPQVWRFCALFAASLLETRSGKKVKIISFELKIKIPPPLKTGKLSNTPFYRATIADMNEAQRSGYPSITCKVALQYMDDRRMGELNKIESLAFYAHCNDCKSCLKKRITQIINIFDGKLSG